ncbi:hypothetical protein BJ684DRAFT_21690, partial [Piptocephalis cylindrospora]
NPGAPEYYVEFLNSLREKAPPNTELFAVAHLGHSNSHLSLPRTGHVFTLDDQVDHKIELVDSLSKAYPRSKLILIGHSIGTYLALNTLKVREEKIFRVYGLFPTIDNILDTPNGHSKGWALRPTSISCLAFLAGALSLLPFPLLVLVTRLMSGQADQEARVTAQHFLNPSVIRNCLNMFANEGEQVLDPDTEILEKYASRIILYYGSDDGWVPRSCYERMRAMHPQVRAYLCEDNLPHAFVLGHGMAMAVKVATWLYELTDESSK